MCLRVSCDAILDFSAGAVIPWVIPPVVIKRKSRLLLMLPSDRAVEGKRCCRYTCMLLHIHINQQHGLALLTNVYHFKLARETSISSHHVRFTDSPPIDREPLYTLTTRTGLTHTRVQVRLTTLMTHSSSLQYWLSSHTQVPKLTHTHCLTDDPWHTSTRKTLSQPSQLSPG